MSRRSMRTLTLAAAAEKTGLGIERLRRAVLAGEIHAFRDCAGRAKDRGRIYVLEASLERWFFARVTGNDAVPAEELPAPLRDVDAELLADTPVEDRFV